MRSQHHPQGPDFPKSYGVFLGITWSHLPFSPLVPHPRSETPTPSYCYATTARGFHGSRCGIEPRFARNVIPNTLIDRLEGNRSLVPRHYLLLCSHDAVIHRPAPEGATSGHNPICCPGPLLSLLLQLLPSTAALPRARGNYIVRSASCTRSFRCGDLGKLFPSSPWIY
ncbi:hypothetical protein BJV74DRAFT_152827 [Russula compacta]|nr:hypothetical protein BJV74DRAFT_152827 [Russula compacta]